MSAKDTNIDPSSKIFWNTLYLAYVERVNHESKSFAIQTDLMYHVAVLFSLKISTEIFFARYELKHQKTKQAEAIYDNLRNDILPEMWRKLQLVRQFLCDYFEIQFAPEHSALLIDEMNDDVDVMKAHRDEQNELERQREIFLREQIRMREQDMMKRSNISLPDQIEKSFPETTEETITTE